MRKWNTPQYSQGILHSTAAGAISLSVSMAASERALRNATEVQSVASKCLMTKNALEILSLEGLHDKVAKDGAAHVSILSHWQILVHMQLPVAAIAGSELHTTQSTFQWLNEVGQYHGPIQRSS